MSAPVPLPPAPPADPATAAPRRDRSAGHFAAAVYGSILVTALVAALDHEHASAGALVGSVAATIGVFWLAHVWSGIVGERLAATRGLDWRRIAAIAGEEWPMVEAALLPLAALALAWSGAYPERTGITVALVIGIAHLIGWGVAVGHRTFGTWQGSLVSGVVDGALGLGIVLLELAIH